jgi:hypothetical protein
MAKMRWTEARWAKRAQKARVLADNTLTPIRRLMMLEMAEFYDRLAKLTRDFKTARGRPLAQPRERGKVPGGVARPPIAAKPSTLSFERTRPPGAPRMAKRPQGKRGTSLEECGCVVAQSDRRQGTLANEAPATLEL